MIRTAVKLVAFVSLSTACVPIASANEWNAREYDLYPGDFNGDGTTDILFVAKDASKPSGISMSGTSGPGEAPMSWSGNWLGIQWYGGAFIPHVGDFNRDGTSEILMQRQSPGDHYLLKVESLGSVSIYQTIPNNCRGVDWSGAAHKIHVGSFSNDYTDDFFLQSTDPEGINAVITTRPPNGWEGDFGGDVIQCATMGPDQSWEDGYLGFKWSTRDSSVYVGYFSNHYRADLLIQPKPKIVMIDFDIPIPVPVYAPNSFGVVYSSGGAPFFQLSGVRAWSRQAFGVDWAPSAYNLVVGNFDNSSAPSSNHARPLDEILFQARGSGRSSFVLGSAPGNGDPFGGATALSSGVTWSAGAYRLLAGNFTGGGTGVYFQAVSPSGTNYITSSVLGSPSLAAHSGDAAVGIYQSTFVGRTAGYAGVTKSGQATYTVPIDLPQVNGLAPQLAATYNSASGPGLFGPRWSLSGMMAVTRCAGTYAQNAVYGGPLMEASDRYCLNGDQLRHVSGTYAGNGSTYRTELEEFSIITAHGTAGNGPQWFEVEAKNGLRYEYGASESSRSMAVHPSDPFLLLSTVKTWSLNRISDRAGNYIHFEYARDPVVFQNYTTKPTSIEYGAANSSTPVYIVDFDYNDNLYYGQYYLSGGPLTRSGVISRIRLLHGGDQVRSYHFQYAMHGNNGVPNYQLLTGVQACARSTAECLEPLQFDWTVADKDWLPMEGGVATASADPRHLRSLDFNGDGHDDLAFLDVGAGRWRVLWGSANGYAGASDTPAAATAGADSIAVVMDVDGNGREDLLVGPIVWNWVSWQPGGFTLNSANISDLHLPDALAAALDVNGDGYQDLVTAGAEFTDDFEVTEDKLYIHLHASDGGPSFGSSTTAGPAPGGGTITALRSGNLGANHRNIDVDGDGREDLFLEKGSGHSLLYSRGQSFEAAQIVSSGSTVYGPLPLIAVSSGLDRCTDVLFDHPSYEGLLLRNSTCGIGITPMYPSAAGHGRSYDSSFVVFDATGGGADEHLHYNGSGSGIQGWHLTGGDIPSSGIATRVNLGFPGNTAAIFASDVDGDGLLDITHVDANGVVRLHRKSGDHSNLLTTVTDGFENSVTFSYGSSASDGCVTSDGTAPPAGQGLRRSTQKRIVVCDTASSDGAGGSYTTSYTYHNATDNMQGRGFAGFERRTVTDSRTGVTLREDHRLDFPYTGSVSYSLSTQSDGKKLREAWTAFDKKTFGSGYETRVWPFAEVRTVDSYGVSSVAAYNGARVTREVTTVNATDSYGNATQVTLTTQDKDATSPRYDELYTAVTTTSFDYAQAAANQCWLADGMTRTTTLPDGTSRTNTQSTTDIDYGMCRPEEIKVEPGDLYLEVKTNYGYEPSACGNITSITVTGRKHDGSGALPGRTTTMGYGSACRLPETVTTALGVVTRTYDYALGVLETETDPNGLTTTIHHDPFGRATHEINPDQTSTEIRLQACTASNNHCGVPDLRIRKDTIVKDASGNAIRTSYQYADGFGRIRVEDEPLPLTGVLSHIVTTYDALGRVESRTVPYSSAYQGKMVFEYDLLGRRRSARLYDDSGIVLRHSGVRYEGLKRVFIDPKGYETARVYDATGQLRSVTDPGTNAVTRYGYTFEGNGVLAATITDAKGSELISRENRLGSPVQSVDPDTGTWSFWHNSLGELMRQLDAKSQETTLTYDGLGRPLSKVEKTSGGAVAATTTFVYGTAAHNTSLGGKYIGRLRSMSKGGYSETYFYDGLGRPQSIEIGMGADGAYTVGMSYEPSTGLIDTLTYPASTGPNPLKVKYGYSDGVQTSVRDFTGNQLGTVFWELNATDAAGRATDESLGNGMRIMTGFDPTMGHMTSRQSGAGGSTTNRQNLSYQWDDNGNLERRTDLNQAGLYEHFYYDALNRLDYSTLNGATNLNLSYDEIGNITYKSDVGSYTYPPSGPTAVRPHAVTAAGSTSYGYDDNGNMASRSGATFTWNVDNTVKKITQGSLSNEFWYGPNGQRFKQQAAYSGGSETTLYIAGLMEKLTLAGGGIGYRHYIAAGSSTVIHTRWSSGATDTYYVSSDHLGSYSSITDQSGAVVVNESFDAFGKRRASNWTNAAPPGSELQDMANVARRGYTSHEHLDNLGLIHMNGRIQDPTLGRFLSADPFIQAPDFSQSLNPYSYAWNNPLTLIDPSGFQTNCPINVVPEEVVVCAEPIEPPFAFNFNSTIGNGGTISTEPFIEAVIVNAARYVDVNGASTFAYMTRTDLGDALVTVTQLSEFRMGPAVRSAFVRRGGAFSLQVGPDRSGVENATNLANLLFSGGSMWHGDGLGLWRGQNGQLYSDSWGGNGATGPRKVALGNRALLAGTARFFGVVGVGQSIVDVTVDINTGSDQLFGHSVDLGLGIYGLFGGIPGAVVGGAYFVGKATGLNAALAKSRMPIVEAQLDALNRYGSLTDCMCGL